jgi:hypothetical protein
VTVVVVVPVDVLPLASLQRGVASRYLVSPADA